MLNILGICHLHFLVFLPDSETNGLNLTNPVEGVFHASVGRYNLNFYDAQRVCEIHGATLATYDQLYDAWSTGLEHCAYVIHFVLVYFYFIFFNLRPLSLRLFSIITRVIIETLELSLTENGVYIPI